MTAAEFGVLAPSDLNDLWEAWEQREARLDLRAGVIAASIAGGSPADFFPSLLPPPPATTEELEAKIESVFASLGAA